MGEPPHAHIGGTETASKPAHAHKYHNAGRPSAKINGNVGFKQKDEATALQLRAQWMDSLGEDHYLTTDDLSSQSSDWDGENDEEDNEKDNAKKAAAAGGAGAEATRAAEAVGCGVDAERVGFSNALERFASTRLIQSGDGAPALSNVHKEPTLRRLRRAHKEVDALCAWAEARNISAGSLSEGACGVGHEAQRLGREVQDVSGLVQRAVASEAPAEETVIEKVMAVPKQIWLPSSKRSDVAAVQHLLELKNCSGARERASSDAVETLGSGVSYQLSAPAGKQGAGWMMATEVEALTGLEERVKRVREFLGAREKSEKDTGTLLGTVAELDQRLHCLQQVSEETACERLRVTVQLLCADIDGATAQAEKLEALEIEEREHNLQMAANADDDFPADESPAEQIEKLYEQCSSIAAVVKKVDDVSRQLVAQDAHLGELSRFARDLAGAEERTRHATEILQAIVDVAGTMQAAAFKSREQLTKNVKAIEAKLASQAAQVAQETKPNEG